MKAALTVLLLSLELSGSAFAQPTGVSQQALTGGTAVSQAEEQRLGLVNVRTYTVATGAGVGCSGILLTNVWALTAGHCLDSMTGRRTDITVTGVPGVYTADAIYKFGAWANDPAGPDLGLVRLSRPVPLDGSTNSFFTRLNRDDPTGKTSTVYGRSTGGYLSLTTRVSSVGGRTLQIEAGPVGETTAQGDSGGPVFVQNGGQSLLAGITSTTNGTAATIHNHEPWITVVARTFLDQSQPFGAADAYAEEVSAVPEGAPLTGPPVNQLRALGLAHWASAQRAAQVMCFNRGFIGGHFIPTTTRGEEFRFACIGRSGGAFYDATQADLDGSGWGFQDINSVNWAQGARAAAGVCQARVPGSVGGFMTGYMLRPPGASDQRMGIICINPSAGSFSDVDAELLPVAGRYDLNEVPWLSARADAAQFCRGFGYVGGFSNGHQSLEKRGITCIGRSDIILGGFPASVPAEVLSRRRALYAESEDAPLLAPPDAAIEVQLSFESCHDTVLLGSAGGCPVGPEYEIWSYDPATHRLLHVLSGRCVNISGARTDVEAEIILYPCVGSANEKWEIVRAPTDSPTSSIWTLKSEHSGLCLTAYRPSRQQGEIDVIRRAALLRQAPCDGRPAQRFTDVDADWYRRNGPN